MKKATVKFFSVVMLAMIALLFGCIGFGLPAWASAEGMAANDPAPAVLFDLTDVLIAVVLAVCGFLWRKWVRPWLEKKDLMDEAAIVVNAVEALMGRSNGAEKWKLAVEKMKAYGFNVDADAVLDALRVAWRNMNADQIMTGEKEKPPEQAAA